MQEKTLLKPKHRTANIHSSELGSVSYDIFGSPYQKSGSFLAEDSLDFGYLGKPYNADTELYDFYQTNEVIKKRPEMLDNIIPKNIFIIFIYVYRYSFIETFL